MPPEVDPLHAPTGIRNVKNITAKTPKLSKSQTAKPVDVNTVTMLNVISVSARDTVISGCVANSQMVNPKAAARVKTIYVLICMSALICFQSFFKTE